jgi:hypothetical protein
MKMEDVVVEIRKLSCFDQRLLGLFRAQVLGLPDDAVAGTAQSSSALTASMLDRRLAAAQQAQFEHAQEMANNEVPSLFFFTDKTILSVTEKMKAVGLKPRYCIPLCMSQCARTIGGQPVPHWHPVEIGDDKQPYFSAVVWEDGVLLKTLKPVIAFSFAAVKIAASLYGIPLPNFSDSLLGDCGLDLKALVVHAKDTAAQKGVSLDTSMVFASESDVIAFLQRNGLTDAALAPKRLDGEALAALQKLFPLLVCTGFDFLMTDRAAQRPDGTTVQEDSCQEWAVRQGWKSAVAVRRVRQDGGCVGSDQGSHQGRRGSRHCTSREEPQGPWPHEEDVGQVC